MRIFAHLAMFGDVQQHHPSACAHSLGNPSTLQFLTSEHAEHLQAGQLSAKWFHVSSPADKNPPRQRRKFQGFGTDFAEFPLNFLQAHAARTSHAPQCTMIINALFSHASHAHTHGSAAVTLNAKQLSGL